MGAVAVDWWIARAHISDVSIGSDLLLVGVRLVSAVVVDVCLFGGGDVWRLGVGGGDAERPRVGAYDEPSVCTRGVVVGSV